MSAENSSHSILNPTIINNDSLADDAISSITSPLINNELHAHNVIFPTHPTFASHGSYASDRAGSPSIHPISSLTACSSSIEELRLDYNLRVGDPCPVCSVRVGLHCRSGSATSSSAANVSSSSAASILMKLRSNKLLPAWDSRTSICRVFLADVKRCLSMSGIADREWFRAFAFTVSERHSSEWVDINITQAQPSFDHACSLFKSHFESASADVAVAQELDSCYQQPKESVQLFADRFLDIVSRAGLDYTNSLVLRQFIHKLTPHMRSKYFTALETKTLMEPKFRITSLNQLADFVIRLDVLNQARQAAMQQFVPPSFSTKSDHRRDGSAHHNGSVTAKTISCSFHPNFSTHSTSECRLNKNLNKTDTAKASSKHSAPAGSVSVPQLSAKIKCHHCGEDGHIRPRCPQLQSARSFNAQTANTAAQWRSPQPGSAARSPASQSNVSEALRQTTRPTVAPNRNFPSAKAVEKISQDPSSVRQTAEVSTTTTSAKLCSLETLSNLPPDAFRPKAELLVKVNDRVFRSLIDSGASISYVDPSVSAQLALSVQPMTGTVGLAEFGSVTSRTGRTDPVHVTFLFLWSRKHVPAKTLKVQFDLLRLPKDQPFIIGRDLIHILFGDSLPCDFIAEPSEAQPSIQASAIHPNASILLNDIIPMPNNERAISQLQGVGSIPSEEMPDRASVGTNSEKEAEYSLQRALIFADPAIKSALQTNAAIPESEFCTLPESVVHLQIDQSKASTLFRKQYPVAEAAKTAVTDIVNRWFQTGKITFAPPNCQFNNPICVAHKKDADGRITGIRVCLDVRALNNAIIVTDKFPIPKIRTCLEMFSNRDKFGEFDLAEAYLQLRLAPNSRQYTAFTWNNHQYIFVGCPFGLALLPSHCQRMMSFIFSDLHFTFPYLDNLPFASSTWQDHRDHALAIIHRLTQYNLRIKPSSVKFGYPELKCLGHLLTGSGISISPSKLLKVQEWPLPKSGEQLQKFLGFAGFLRQHVRHYADLTASMEAVKREKEIIWTDTLRESFEATKRALSAAPILKFPDFENRFVIATDASNTGIGGILFQPDSKENLITANNIVNICSKKLSNCQRNYPAYKKELFAIVYSLRQFHSFVWGRTDLIILTDHKPLIYILSSETLSPALQQWLDVLLDYRYTVHHRPGILNVLPDALSRMYSAMYPATWGVPSQNLVTIDNDGNMVVNESAHVAKAVASSSDAGGENAQRQQSRTINLAVELERRGMTSPPADQRLQLIETMHYGGGHFGRDALYRSLWSKKIWWPNMRADIETVLGDCDACARYVVTKQGYHPASFITANAPWDHIQIDTSVHLPKSPDGYTALLVIIDVFTGFIQLRPLITTDAATVARKLWKLFAVFGVPKVLQSDNGPEFSNDVVRTLAKLTGIDQRFISPYNPRADGKVERSIGTIMGIIKKLLHGTNHDWPCFVPFAQMTFNQKVSSLTNSSPFTLMFGRSFNELKDYSSEEIRPIDLELWKEHQHKILSLIYPAISEKVLVSKQKMVQSLNNHRRQLTSNSIPPGAVVMLIDQLRANKFEPKYVGPYVVVRRARNGAYVLKDMTGDILDRHVPADQLKLVKRHVPSTNLKSNVYEVKRVLDHRGEPGQYEYLVRWEGFGAGDDSWISQDNFQDTACITKYWKSIQDRR